MTNRNLTGRPATLDTSESPCQVIRFANELPRIVSQSSSRCPAIGIPSAERISICSQPPALPSMIGYGLAKSIPDAAETGLFCQINMST